MPLPEGAGQEPLGEPVLGISAPMRALEALLARTAPYAQRLVISGESGAGKEVVARRIHELASGGSDEPFVAVNCGAFAESLLESELFGHERGAFTGASRTRAGVFEQANGGTLLLDEVTEMSRAMQVKVLRVLQEGQVRRVGSERPLPVVFRLVCATNRDLAREVSEGRFREDLFYRVNVVHLRVPPLRERPADVPWLATKFIDALNAAHPDHVRSWGPGVMESLLRHPWPGNVRELRHCIEQAWVLSEGPSIECRDLAPTLAPSATAPPGGIQAGISPGRGRLQGGADGAPWPTGLRSFLRECERAHILDALERNDWAIARTAEALAISRKNLWERMRRLGITEGDSRAPSDAPPGKTTAACHPPGRRGRPPSP